ncbi:Amino Acid-Polyamine-Organocation (APC) Family [Phytophthora cinnamomi]|uniref:Amino Acid-Polyamine-Organocation (APC) Family n=1 Tax=Phytophthora cinnamomi TaxID=4785 RepID=UPI00355A97AF|nr:Amino Acid-Polyamine-Organocation (APC) Family [Phytophthora cinnamomi]
MTKTNGNGDLRLDLLGPDSPSGDYAHLSGITSLSVHQPTDLGWVSEMNFIRADTPSQLRQRFIQIQVTDQRFKEPSWMHPNIGGEAQYVQGRADEIAAISEELKANETKNKLGEWTATSISGNAILSSVLFSAGQTIAKAGKLAPVTQLFVVTVVYCLRWVFEEVMSAVPLNGGFYTAVLNSAPKKICREEIPRKRTTSWANTCFCLGMISMGILANAFSDVKALSYFFIYFAVFFLVVFLMLTRLNNIQKHSLRMQVGMLLRASFFTAVFRF